MAFKPLYALAIVLVNVLTVIVTSSARSTGLVRLTELHDELDRPVYSWMISQDEEERLSALLEADFHDTGVAGTYVTAPPQTCPHCGKETEFIDWVYTALKRGVHSPEFLLESLKAGRTPEGVHHDVYCSGCGHLTHVRDHSGNEGGALHITHATPYDRSTRTFGKREAEPVAPEAVVVTDEHSEPLEKKAAWCQRCTAGNWLIEREDEDASVKGSSEPLEKKAAWCQRCTAGNWIIKREDNDAVPGIEEVLPELEKKAAWCQRCTAGNWLIKREDEVASSKDSSEPLEKKAAWCQRCTAGNWIIKRDEEDAAPVIGEVLPELEKKAAWCQRCTAGNWLIKREDEAASVKGPSEPLEKKAAWCQRCTAGNWLIKREEDDAAPAIGEVMPELEKKAAWCQRCTAGNWIIKREVESD
ncbi:hypothetical protein L226DRAFT_534357 [Lentinus tigrinus ALCF2SS1-7]|uniref:uncharacterized protein n=1 Tax=Lentinus tigrinus ALCF2SS1-7 TaxID=1328758 RepID=UPI0011663AFE|nr:hypothetical protein L226DRAFT_534357 [Lentinus tigrinus ALCF2SS1-7]